MLLTRVTINISFHISIPLEQEYALLLRYDCTDIIFITQFFSIIRMQQWLNWLMHYFTEKWRWFAGARSEYRFLRHWSGYHRQSDVMVGSTHQDESREGQRRHPFHPFDSSPEAWLTSQRGRFWSRRNPRWIDVGGDGGTGFSRMCPANDLRTGSIR